MCASGGCGGTKVIKPSYSKVPKPVTSLKLKTGSGVKPRAVFKMRGGR